MRHRGRLVTFRYSEAGPSALSTRTTRRTHRRPCPDFYTLPHLSVRTIKNFSHLHPHLLPFLFTVDVIDKHANSIRVFLFHFFFSFSKSIPHTHVARFDRIFIRHLVSCNQRELNMLMKGLLIRVYQWKNSRDKRCVCAPLTAF